MNETLHKIDTRYGQLAESSCCLSCGGALGHADVRPGETALDLGSGRGTDCLRMADLVGPEGRVHGIDIADGMLEKARATATRLGATNVDFHRAALESLPMADASIDVVLSNCVLNHAGDKAAVWREIFRVLKPGGRFAVSDIYALDPVPEAFRNDPEAVAECWAGADTREVYLATVEAVGFPVPEIREESAPYEKGAIRVASFTLVGRKPEAPGKPTRLATRRACCGG